MNGLPSPMRLVARLATVAVIAGIVPLVIASPAAAARTKSIKIADASIVEGDNGQQSLAFKVTWSGSKGGSAPSVSYTTADDTALAGSDYTAKSATATLTNGGCHCATISVPVLGDHVYEGTETFFVNLSNPVNGTLADAQAVGTIYDNEGPPTLVVTDVAAAEASGSLALSVQLTTASASPVSVDYATADGTATAGSDYQAVSGTLNFSAGETAKPVTVTVTDDALAENDETVLLDLSNASGASVADPEGVGTIQDDDPDPNVSVADASVTEGNIGTKKVTFTVSLDAPAGRETAVDYATADATATAGVDYQAATGTVTIPAGNTSGTFQVTIIGDVLHEGAETFTITLSGEVALTIADGTAIGTINDNDAVPTIGAGDVSMAEGDSGSSQATVTFTLSNPTIADVSVDYATSDGTATAGVDYTAASGTVTILAGSLTTTVNVDVLGDTTAELDETFHVGLSNPVNASLGLDGTVTITDDDTLTPTVGLDNVSTIEGNSGTKQATLTLTLSAPSAVDVSVDYATSDGTATAGADYTATSGTATILAGNLTTTIPVQTLGDLVDEPDETFEVSLNNPVNAVLGTNSTVTIKDNDAHPTIGLDDVTILEGNTGSKLATLTLTLSNPSAFDVSVDYATSDGTATGGADYAATTGSVTIPAGSLTGTIEVPVLGDLVDEPNETFQVGLSAPVNALLGTDGTVTITDNDLARTVLTVRAIKDRTTLKAKGLLELATSKLHVTVTLFQKKAKRFVRVSSRIVAVKGLKDRDGDGLIEGQYRAVFARPVRGTYRFRVVFKGSSLLKPSRKSLTFKI